MEDLSSIKILFVTRAGGLDYQSDTLFHGLVTLGVDVTDTSDLWYLGPITEKQRMSLYGNGFTIAGKLGSRVSVNRDPDTVKSRIESRYYDAVIYGSVRRCSEYYDLVTRIYSPERVAFVDGEDRHRIATGYFGKGLYFKRELCRDVTPTLLPISFSIPETAFVRDSKVKVRDFSRQVPGCRGENYLFTDERDYYLEYGTSRFALTWRKAGWDCLRHYEIVAAGSLPFFPDFQYCPSTTMTTWPRKLQTDVNRLVYRWIAGTTDMRTYDQLLSDFVAYGRENLTTEKTARYVLEKLGLV